MTDTNLQLSLAHYRELAPRYDDCTRRIDAIRERAIDALCLRSGETVVDAGCGTGWCLPRLLERVGHHGHVIGFDPSSQMLDVARARLNGQAAQVEFLDASAQAVRVPASADAVLFSYTHDLLRSPAALDNVLGQMKPGARVVAVGSKLFTAWLFPANWFVRYRHRGYITNFESLEAPWSLLATYLDDFAVTAEPMRQHYLATGRIRARPASYDP
ncbi:MAG TPA: methyltransferase domain-containing protein [Usitatibacter sp.]